MKEPVPRTREAGPSFCWSLAAVLAGLLTGGTACNGSRPVTPAVEAAGPGEEPAGPPLFVDVTAGSSVHFTYRNGEEAGHYAILESLGGGVALIDYDGDGLLDIFLTGGGYFDGKGEREIKGHPHPLFQNLGDSKVKDRTPGGGPPPP